MSPLRRLAFTALLAFVASVPLEDAVQFGVGRISKVLGGLALVAWAISVLGDGRVRRPSSAHLTALAFVGWAAASYAWAARPGAALGKISVLVQLCGLVFLVWDLVERHAQVVLVMRAYLVGTIVAAATIAAKAGSTTAAEGVIRFAPGAGDPNSAACMLAIGVGVAWYLVVADRSPRARLLAAASIPVTVLGLVLTASRSGLLAAGLIAVLALARPQNVRARRLLPLLLLGAATVLAVQRYVPSETLARLGTTEQEIGSGSFNQRSTYWHEAADTFAHHPVAGIGTNMFKDAAGGADRRAHNLVLGTAAELGIVGVGLLLLTFGLTWVGVARSTASGLKRPWLGIVAAWTVGAMSLNWDVRKVTWLLLAVALAEAGARVEGWGRRHDDVAWDDEPRPDDPQVHLGI
jgi:O-antigen ligase